MFPATHAVLTEDSLQYPGHIKSVAETTIYEIGQQYLLQVLHYF
jgi:hypothetical protein